MKHTYNVEKLEKAIQVLFQYMNGTYLDTKEAAIKILDAYGVDELEQEQQNKNRTDQLEASANFRGRGGY